MGGYAADCDAISAHADTLTWVEKTLGRVSAVARPVSDEAFGVIGRPFARALIGTGAATSDAITALGGNARADQAGLRGTAEAYLRREAEQVREFDSIHGAGERR
jgi:hypothetical protein